MNLGLKPSSVTSLSSSWKSTADGLSGQFPAGLRVLVVDDDPTCLRILDKMLNNCLYAVTTCNRAEVALKFLRYNKSGYDIVISDVHMPDMDGFKLLEHVGLEMDLPVIMMSADDSKNIVMKGVTHGACDYLLKPVRMEALRNIWQHVVRKMKHDHGEQQQKPQEDHVNYSEENWKSSKKQRKDDKEDAGDDDDGDSSSSKRPRVVWSVKLHQQFVTAVNQLGFDKAVPKKILELMNVPSLTRENVASHLQKYRLYLRRLSRMSQHHNAPLGSIPSLDGVHLHALATSNQLPPQKLATIPTAEIGRANPMLAVPVPLLDQRNVFNFENLKLRFAVGEGQQIGDRKQVDLLHGIPTNMDELNYLLGGFLADNNVYCDMNSNGGIWERCLKKDGSTSQTHQNHLPSVVLPTVSFEQRFWSYKDTNGNQSHNWTGRQPDIPFPNSLFAQEDIMAALVEQQEGLESVESELGHNGSIGQFSP